VISQVTQRGGVAVTAREEVLVDAQYLRATPGMPLAKLALESTLKVALHGGRSDPFTATQPAAVDSVPVLTEDHFLEGFARTLAPLHPWKPLPEVAPAIIAAKFRGF
jgi:hypothetical protein